MNFEQILTCTLFRKIIPDMNKFQIYCHMYQHLVKSTHIKEFHMRQNFASLTHVDNLRIFAIFASEFTYGEILVLNDFCKNMS